jgi:hypothetical protein
VLLELCQLGQVTRPLVGLVDGDHLPRNVPPRDPTPECCRFRTRVCSQVAGFIRGWGRLPTALVITTQHLR